VAEALGVSRSTVATHIAHLYDKLGVSSLAAVAGAVAQPA
jgi:DNA-binding CsgD family transcriptional regulator